MTGCFTKTGWGTAKTYAGSAFVASIDQNDGIPGDPVTSGESWAPNFEGYGYMTPALVREGIQRIAVVTLNKDVQLPEGAEVTAFSCYWYDNDLSGDIDFVDANLFRRELLGVGSGGRGVTSLARISTTPGGMNGTTQDTIQSALAPAIIEPVIDNESFSYYINVVFSLGDTTPANSSKIRWYGCQVKYRMPE